MRFQVLYITYIFTYEGIQTLLLIMKDEGSSRVEDKHMKIAPEVKSLQSSKTYAEDDFNYTFPTLIPLRPQQHLCVEWYTTSQTLKRSHLGDTVLSSQPHEDYKFPRRAVTFPTSPASPHSAYVHALKAWRRNRNHGCTVEDPPSASR